MRSAHVPQATINSLRTRPPEIWSRRRNAGADAHDRASALDDVVADISSPCRGNDLPAQPLIAASSAAFIDSTLWLAWNVATIFFDFGSMSSV